jgi:methyl-accepting chemotaxis protein
VDQNFKRRPIMGNQAPRRIVFIDKKFQANFILKFLGLLLAGTALFNVAAYLILNRRLEGSLYNAHMTIKSVGEILLPSLLSLSVVFLLLLSVVILMMTLFVSHLIAGPLYAIRRYIERIGEGELDFEARLRSKDQTTPLALTLSDTMQVLNTRISTIQAAAKEIHESARDLAGAVETLEGKDDATSGTTARIAALSAKLVDEAEFFKTRTGDPRP